MRYAEAGIVELQKHVDTLLVIPNQNLFRVANEKTTFADAFAMADQVLYSGVACITDLMVKEGLINLDFADVRAVMREMGKAMMGTGEASGEKRAHDRRGSRDLQSADRRLLDEGRQGRADLDHRRQGSDPVRGRRGRDPHPRGSGQGRQHHRRRDLRRKPRRHHPRLGGRDRHRQGRGRCAAGQPARRSASRRVRAPRHKVERAAPCRRSRIRRACGASAIEQAATAAVGRRRCFQPIGDRRRHHPLDAAQALAVRGSELDAGRRLRPSSGRAGYAGAFIPPQAERIPQRPRMPRIEELPMPAQRQILAQARRTAAQPASGKAAQVSLFKRLASRARPRQRAGGSAGAGTTRIPPTAASAMPTGMPQRPAVPPDGEARTGLRICAAPAAPRRASIRMAGRPLCIIRRRTINWKSRLSCAVRPIEARTSRLLDTSPGPSGRGFCFRAGGRSIHFIRNR